MQPLSLPVLASAAASPILEFERRILDSMTDIEHWFRQSWQEHTPPFYGSVDLRNAGFKLAPVDMNLFRAASTTCPKTRCRARCRRLRLSSSAPVPMRASCC